MRASAADAAVFVAVGCGLLLGILRATVYTCAGERVSDVTLVPAYQSRAWTQGADWPLWLSVVELCVHVARVLSGAAGAGSVGGARIGVVFTALRLGYTSVTCAHADCPSVASGFVLCEGAPCYLENNEYVQWMAPLSMCPLPPGYLANNARVPLADMPRLVRCRTAGCSAAATPLSTFVVNFMVAASAFSGVVLIRIKRRALAAGDS